MTSRGDIHRQLSQIMGTINAQDYKLEDVAPTDMQNHFQDMVALNEARAYIKEVEARERELQESNKSLQAQLQAKQTELDDLPEDFKALRVDLRQSQICIDFHKGIAERESERAAQYQSKFEKASRQQLDTAEDARKIRQLEKHLSEREANVFRLLEENKSIRDVYEAKLDESLQRADDKDATITTLRHRVVQLEMEASQERETSDELTETYDILMDNVGQANSTAAEVINAKSIQLFSERWANNQFHSGLVSEIGPLNAVYKQAFDILEVYRTSLEGVLASKHTVHCNLPQSLDIMLDFMEDQLHNYKQIAAELRLHSDTYKDDSPQAKVLEQVDTLAYLAANMYMSLETSKQHLSEVLARIRDDTASQVIGDDISGKRIQAPLTQGSSASQSTASSFTSIVKRFSVK